MSIIIKSSSINADFYVNKSLDYRPIAYTQCMIPWMSLRQAHLPLSRNIRLIAIETNPWEPPLTLRQQSIYFTIYE